MLEVKRNGGFGWVEALITLVIIAILLALAVPSMQSYFQGVRFRGALSDIAASAELARTEAIRRNATVFVSIVDGPNWCLGVGSTSCRCTDCDIRSIEGAQNYSDIVVTSSIPGGGYQIDPANGIASDAGTLTVTVAGRKGTVTVSRLARASVCKANCGQTP